MLAWLLQAGPKDAKHRSKSHPLVTFCLHYAAVALITVSTHDWMIARTQPQQQQQQSEGFSATGCTPPVHRQWVGFFLGVYFVLFFCCRLALHWNHHDQQQQGDFYIEFYKQTFLCSVTIFHTALGLYTNRPILAESFCVAVGIDQILWYVDLTGKILINKFPIGVTKYLFWPGTSWASRLTSTHHLWTIPVVQWASGGGIRFLALPLSAVVVLVNVLLSRLLTPHSIAATDDEKYPSHYLNLNLAYELWTDIKMPFLLVLEGRVPYLIRLLVAWWSFNAVIFGLLRVLSTRILGPPIMC